MAAAWCGASQYNYPPGAAHTARLADIPLLQAARLFSHQISSHTSRSCTMCTGFGYSTVLHVRQLLYRPQRPHSTGLAAPRAIGRATSEVGTGPVHLTSRCATIAPTTRHPGQQLAATTTLGKVAAGVAPASTTIHPGRPTRPGWPAYLYCRRQGCFRTKYLRPHQPQLHYVHRFWVQHSVTAAVAQAPTPTQHWPGCPQSHWASQQRGRHRASPPNKPLCHHCTNY